MPTTTVNVSPTAGQDCGVFVRRRKAENRIVRGELAERPFSPINAGLSCLAALPSKSRS
jgi:hypothetical protein